MSYSVELLVEALVKSRDRASLQRMREHRERVRRNMLKIDGLEFTDRDLPVIEAGLLRLNSPESDHSGRPRPK
jgi:hypothetical protein